MTKIMTGVAARGTLLASLMDPLYAPRTRECLQADEKGPLPAARMHLLRAADLCESTEPQDHLLAIAHLTMANEKIQEHE